MVGYVIYYLKKLYYLAVMKRSINALKSSLILKMILKLLALQKRQSERLIIVLSRHIQIHYFQN